MYYFHYNFIKMNFSATLLFTNTDSLTYEIKSENVYKEFFKWKDLFDFSNYSKDSEFFDNANKKVIGKMKDEYRGVIIDQFIGLKSNMYSIKKINGTESSTTKGVNIATEFDEFKDVLFHKKVIRTYEIDKISLSYFDDKRYVLDDGVNNFVYFHKDCNKKCDKSENNNNNNNDNNNDNHNND